MPKDTSDRATRAKVRALVKKNGLRATATQFGLHRETVLGLLADVNVRAGTIALVREKLGASATA